MTTKSVTLEMETKIIDTSNNETVLGTQTFTYDYITKSEKTLPIPAYGSIFYPVNTFVDELTILVSDNPVVLNIIQDNVVIYQKVNVTYNFRKNSTNNAKMQYNIANGNNFPINVTIIEYGL